MRKPGFGKCKNKGSDQLWCNNAADRNFCFCYKGRTITLLPQILNFKPLAIFYGCTAQFVSELVRNPKDRFSNDEAHIGSTEVLLSLLLSSTDPFTGTAPFNVWTDTTSSSSPLASSTG